MNTEVGAQLNTSVNTNVTLRSWEYSKTNQYMEIAFDVQNNNDSQNLIFTATARTNLEKKRALQTSIVLSNSNSLIVQIQNVPKKWDVISLQIEDNQNSLTETSARFYCDKRKVALNESLAPKSNLDYQVEAVLIQISDVEEMIQNIEGQIQLEQSEIEQLNFDINVLRDNQKYQTNDEISKSNSVITSKLSEIDNHKNNILKLENQIAENNLKLQKLNQKLEDTKRGLMTSTNINPDEIAQSELDIGKESITVD